MLRGSDDSFIGGGVPAKPDFLDPAGQLDPTPGDPDPTDPTTGQPDPTDPSPTKPEPTDPTSPAPSLATTAKTHVVVHGIERMGSTEPPAADRDPPADVLRRMTPLLG